MHTDGHSNPRLGGHRLVPLRLQLRDELLEVLPLAQGSKIGVFPHVHHVFEALAHRIAQKLHRSVAVELRRFSALLVVQLGVSGGDGNTQAQKTRGVVGIRRRVPAQVPTGFGGADGVFRLQQRCVDPGQQVQMVAIELAIGRVPGVGRQGRRFGSRGRTSRLTVVTESTSQHQPTQKGAIVAGT